MTLNGDGTYHIVERQVVAFEDGPFTFAFSSISLAESEGVENISVSEERDGQVVEYSEESSGDPETYELEQISSEIRLTWFMPSTTDQQRTFVVEYDVIGALRVYDTETGVRQQIWWTGINEDVTDVAAVDFGSISIELPQAVSNLSDVVLDGPGSDDVEEHTEDGRVFTWTMEDLGEGDTLWGRVEFPAMVNATAPAWQESVDEQRLREQDREGRDSLLRLMMAGAGLLAVTAGGVGLYGLWYTRGRDPGVGELASYLSEPPDDLPPGAAGALVDEVVNERDIVATLVDLGRRGVLNIKEETEGTLFKRRDYKIELKEPTATLRPFEQTFVTAILGNAEPGASADLGDAKASFNSKVSSIKNQMYEELVKRGYFPVSPQTTRSRYQGVASTVLIGGAVLLAILGKWVFGISGWVVLPIAALAIVFIALYQISKFMPRKTLPGAESAAKWRAFKRYLADLDQNRATEGSGELFEKYLPYAVAFGLEESWVSKFAEAGAPAPEWYGGFGGTGDWWGPESRRYPRRRGTGWGGWVGFPSGTGGGASGGDFDFPDMPSPQEASDRGAKSLQSLSGGLMDLFNVAGSAFQSFGGGGRHGGFSGGGRSFGGGGFGGGGGG
ncbi:MAG: DUF2207 domain-containing protein, partial [Chloroflexota bacterium]|nr:DUF2207 domain-containing protein [Chloroflexota bacterium]